MGGLAESDDKPVVFTFTFGSDWLQSQFQSTHSRLLNIIFQKSTLRHARTAQQALALFVEHRQPRAVFVADPAIMASRNEVVSQKLVQYVTGGGVVVFGGVFSSLADRDRLNLFFARTWDVPWTAAGGRNRTATLALNRAAVHSPRLRSRLPAEYTQTALFLQGVELHESWYLPVLDRNGSSSSNNLNPNSNDDDVDDDDDDENGPCAVEADLIESSVVYASFGNGRIGYVGDVNAEEATNAVVLAMMGLL